MDIPDLVNGVLGDEEIQAGVSIGDEDAVCLTPTRTLIYRGEGLLSDESVEEYSHDIEQLAVSEGRRKTKFTMQYIDGTESFTVPANRGEKVLTLFLEGVLRLEGVIDPRESIAGVYRFSELTLIIADGRLIKHIGNQVWTEDFEGYAYEDVTGLEFERASVATSITLGVDGRPQRIKVPNDKAPVVRQTLEEALFNHYDVGSSEELSRVVGTDEQADTGGVETVGATEDEDEFVFGDDFDPLVSEDDDLSDPIESDGELGADTVDEPRADSQPGQHGASSDESQGPATGQSTEGQSPGRRARESDDSPATEPTDQTPGQADPSDGQSVASSSSGQYQSDDARSTAPQSPGETQDRQSSQSPEPESSRSPESQSPTDDADGTTADASANSEQAAVGSTESASAADTSDQRGADAIQEASTGQQSGSVDAQFSTGESVSREEYEALADRVDELTEAVDRQNELLKRQHRALKQLVNQHERSE